MNDETQPTVYRLRAAEALADKALGRGDRATKQIMLHAEQQGPNSLRVIFVSPTRNYDEPQALEIEHDSAELEWSDAETDEAS